MQNILMQTMTYTTTPKALKPPLTKFSPPTKAS